MILHKDLSNSTSKLFLVGIFLLGIISANAQELSPAGHIIIPQKNNAPLKNTNSQFQGNAIFKTFNGYVSIDANYENAPAFIYVYADDASLKYSRKFAQCINAQFSENKKYMAFYNAGNIHVLNLENTTEKIQKGSTFFAVDNFGKVSFLNSNAISVYVDESNVSIPSTLISIKNRQGNWYYITKQGIYVYADGTMQLQYAPKQGIVFDAEYYNNKWYVSTRTKTKEQYSFQLSTITNFHLNSEKTIDSKTYKRVFATTDVPEIIDPKFANRTNELIKNPMDFFSTESYQAIGNSYNEIQEYSPGGQYLHPGVDLFGDHLENVHSVKYGFVKAVLTTSGDYHWRVAIANNNSSNDSSQGYLYAHLDQNLIPVVVGDTVAEGEVIGQLVDFPVTGFVHCHFARIVDKGITWSGSWWTFDDPLYYMSNFKDTTAPVFEEAVIGQKFAFRDSLGNYLDAGNVYGEVDIISKVYDQINTFWKVDVHRVGYLIKELHIPMPIITDDYSFDFNMFNDTYFSGPYVQDIINTMYSRDATCFSIGNYNDRDFYHILTNSNGDDTITSADAAANFNTTLLPNGDYFIEAWAIDAAGNKTIDSMRFTINNFVGINNDRKNNISIYPNPTDGKLTIQMLDYKTSEVKVMDMFGRVVGEYVIDKVRNTIDVSNLPSGLYLLKFEGGSSVKVFRN